MSFPKPDTRNPVQLPDGTAHAGTVFLKAAIDHPRLIIGDYTYASAHVPPDDWAAHLAPNLYPFSRETLTIGKFCQIASGVQIITSSADHRYDGISSYPFAIFDGGAGDGRPSMPTSYKDTTIGHDVWIGAGATLLPGVQIGSGVIIGAGAVVSGDVPAYSIVVGNPSRIVRMRFSNEEIKELLQIAWWDWPIERILAHESQICDGDVAGLALGAAKG